VADVNVDGKADLIWSFLGTTNLTYVALAGSAGAYTLASFGGTSYLSQPETGWTGYTVAAADVSGDHKADLIWNFLGTTNRTYVDLSNFP
jgi:hypothetical protein